MIFYFSGTGNTLWAARKVAEATGDRLIDISETTRHGDNTGELRYTLADGERIGFFFPVHGWRPPLTVRAFVRRLRIDTPKGHYCYAVCTAGDTVGEAMDIFQKDIAAIGLHADSTMSLIMPESYIGLPFMDVDTPANEQRKTREADSRLSDFINDIKERKCGIHDIHTGNWPKTNSRLIGAAFVKWIIGDRPFRVDSDKCTQCGLCARLCPVGDIRGGKGQLPSWLHNGKCLSCFACYHHCPVRAIEYGGRTKGKGQYFYSRNKQQGNKK